jgi:hypothetical protein
MQRCRLLRSSEGRNGKSELRAVTVVAASLVLMFSPTLFTSLLAPTASMPPLADASATMSTSAGLKQTPQRACAGSDRRCVSSSSKSACGAGG